jgi:hypothetical protein
MIEIEVGNLDIDGPPTRKHLPDRQRAQVAVCPERPQFIGPIGQEIVAERRKS